MDPTHSVTPGQKCAVISEERNLPKPTHCPGLYTCRDTSNSYEQLGSQEALDQQAEVALGESDMHRPRSPIPHPAGPQSHLYQLTDTCHQAYVPGACP